ncbi:replication-relaxation family protein [Actinomadura rupiterrae]|uniref:replication-relaxation family protein n=1 Tax=Actinomadura rupiterrae TaxID=559627 RepID=UPI0020A31CDC|nr:replication-relaxation family protein [Actinomadura rupiterrae]MCP2336959.1 hypothetical protein [Actinomadura rupiterrae]
MADLAHRLTPRDRAILGLVWEHKVLTTDQITALFFRTPERTQQRLRELHRHRALSSFRPWTPVGTAANHWVLGPAGAHVLAVERGVHIQQLGYRLETALAIAVSPRLGHQLGVNDFFVRLRAHARKHDEGTRLIRWLSERQCQSQWRDRARPDAYGYWQETDRCRQRSRIKFFLEHDTGTERLASVAAKIDGYAALARKTGELVPVLFWLPSAAREANLRTILDTPKVPVATAVHTPTTDPEGPAGPVWLPAGVNGARHRLACLGHAWEYPA